MASRITEGDLVALDIALEGPTGHALSDWIATFIETAEGQVRGESRDALRSLAKRTLMAVQRREGITVTGLPATTATQAAHEAVAAAYGQYA